MFFGLNPDVYLCRGTPLLPAGCSLGTLRPEHAQLVSSCWEYGGNKMDARIRFMIEHLPSVCIFNERGEPVSWINTYLDGSAGIGKQTVPSQN